MTKREQQSSQQRIMGAAVSLFRRTHDVKKVSLQEIAREARMSPTTIYNNFGTREKLVYEVIKVLLRENLERSRNLIRSDVPFPQKISAIIIGKLDMASKLDGEVIEKILSQDKNIVPFIDQIYESEIQPLWKEMLVDGKKQGYIDASLQDEALLIYLDVLKAGFSARQGVLQKITDNVSTIKQLTHIVFYGFLKKEVRLFNKEGK
jgi:AcrR family transcriptional regulator